MREIIFRAWWKDDNTLVDPKSYVIRPDGTIEFPGGWDLQGCDSSDLVILEQYTGLKDKNGNKIFEGDIVVLSDDTVLPGYRYAISFHDGAFCVGLHDGELFGDFCSIRDGMAQARKYDKEFSICVVGNIYDNPELLT